MAATHPPQGSSATNKKRERASAYSLLLLFGLLIGLYFVFQYVDLLRELVSVQAQIAETQEFVRQSEQNNLDLAAELRYAASEEHVAEVARGELGYIQEGDDVYVLLDSVHPTEQTQAPASVAPQAQSDSFRPFEWNWWQSVFQRIGPDR